MALREQIPQILDYINSQNALMQHNEELFDIFEGNLLEHILMDLKKQVSAQTFDQLQHRVTPINVLKRVVDKLSQIYNEPPGRYIGNVEDDAQPTPRDEKDMELVEYYSNAFDINTKMQSANELFNLFKSSVLEPYVKDGKPKLRALPASKYLVWSSDPVDPHEPTHFIKFMGTRKSAAGEIMSVYHVWTKDEFLPITSRGEVLQDYLNEMGNPTGINPIGMFPVVYINRSKYTLVPTIDTDTLRLTKVLPILISDLAFSVMYQTFSIIYGIDVDDQDIVMSPNAFWRFKSDPTTQSKPEVGVIKPQVDITQVLGFISQTLSFWLQSRGIRPGTVGQIGPENFASGISKIVDEMDTYDERKKQVPYFIDAEKKLWDLIINGYHPYWVQEGMIDQSLKFEPGQTVLPEFPPQKPQVNRKDMIADVKEEMSLGLLTRKDALLRLNPTMSEQEAEEYILEVDEQNSIEVESEASQSEETPEAEQVVEEGTQ